MTQEWFSFILIWDKNESLLCPSQLPRQKYKHEYKQGRLGTNVGPIVNCHRHCSSSIVIVNPPRRPRCQASPEKVIFSLHDGDGVSSEPLCKSEIDGDLGPSWSNQLIQPNSAVPKSQGKFRGNSSKNNGDYLKKFLFHMKSKLTVVVFCMKGQERTNCI